MPSDLLLNSRRSVITHIHPSNKADPKNVFVSVFVPVCVYVCIIYKKKGYDNEGKSGGDIGETERSMRGWKTM